MSQPSITLSSIACRDMVLFTDYQPNEKDSHLNVPKPAKAAVPVSVSRDPHAILCH